MNKTEEFWMKHVEGLKRAGITATAYAKQHGLVVKTFLTWRRKLMLAAVGHHQDKKAAFVALRVAAPIVEQKQPDCVVCFPCGLRIEMATLPAPQWLSELGYAIQGVR